jgi:hypothetical protein
MSARAAKRTAKTPEHLVQTSPELVSRPLVPPCLFPLQTNDAQNEYNTLTRLFITADKLTTDAHRALSEYAAQFDGLHASLKRGLLIRPSRFDQLRRARKALRLRELEQPVATPERAPVNKFANCGFANRHRDREPSPARTQTSATYISGDGARGARSLWWQSTDGDRPRQPHLDRDES